MVESTEERRALQAAVEHLYAVFARYPLKPCIEAWAHCVTNADQEIGSRLRALQQDSTLLQEESFRERVEALDDLEVHVLDPLQALLARNGPRPHLQELRHPAEALQAQLQGVDERLWQGLREGIATGRHTPQGLRSEIVRYAGPLSVDGRHRDASCAGYDALDVFVQGLLGQGQPPQETREREPEMIAYQPTPARLVLQMIDETPIRRDDVFYDVGSGLGRVVLLVVLLTGARGVGIEQEPAYVEYARGCAGRLPLANVSFLALDARDADYSEGTVFFLYTPFRGGILQQVMAKLEAEAAKRVVRVCTYGPCTAEVAREGWLRLSNCCADPEHRVAVFTST